MMTSGKPKGGPLFRQIGNGPDDAGMRALISWTLSMERRQRSKRRRCYWRLTWGSFPQVISCCRLNVFPSQVMDQLLHCSKGMASIGGRRISLNWVRLERWWWNLRRQREKAQSSSRSVLIKSWIEHQLSLPNQAKDMMRLLTTPCGLSQQRRRVRQAGLPGQVRVCIQPLQEKPRSLPETS